MRYFNIILLFFFIYIVCLSAQGSMNIEQQIEEKYKMPQLNEPVTRYMQSHSSLYYHNFYRKNLNGNFLYGPNSSGFSGSITGLKNDKFAMGMIFQLIRIVESNQNVRDAYSMNIQPQDQYYVIPFLLNIRINLKSRASIGDIVPYLVAGFGPAIGLYFPKGNGYFNNLDAVSANIGGGGFIGAGIDYLWIESWALSFDVRYNIYQFTQPLISDYKYNGVTFFVGFSKALDY
jgi:hypothetical protein